MAFGADRYIDQAVTLGRSLHRHAPTIPRAVVTDSDDQRLDRLYDFRIALRPEWGADPRQKLFIDRYTPFDETLFIDSDSIVVRSPIAAFDRFDGAAVGVVGAQIREGYWYVDVRGLLNRFGLEAMPKFNGGVYYLSRPAGASAVFESARDLLPEYEALGFCSFRGGLGDEPLMALALALHGLEASDDRGLLMRTPLGIRGRLRIDAIGGRARFNKFGREVSPAIVHFVSSFAAPSGLQGAHYRRESRKLDLVEARGLPARITSAAIGVAYLPACALSTGRRALVRRRRERRLATSRTVQHV
jgi:hypothetical protein